MNPPARPERTTGTTGTGPRGPAARTAAGTREGGIPCDDRHRTTPRALNAARPGPPYFSDHESHPMPHTSRHLSVNRVRLYQAAQTASHTSFPVKGQGTVSVLPADVPEALDIVLHQDMPFTPTGNACGLTIGRSGIVLWAVRHGKRHTIAHAEAPELRLDPPGTHQPYWLSLDSNNRRIRYGKGEMLRALMLYEFTWPDKNDPDGMDALCRQLRHVSVRGATGVQLATLQIPVNLDPPPHLIAPAEVTMESIAANRASVAGDLPLACQRLYDNVAGPGMNLSPPDFPEFAQAIQYSIVTPGALCHTKLQEKDPSFGYLRVTLDSNQGDSPGQPYVLEIWPAGNGSPIHNHGQACAVIKVLHGQIQISWFSALSPHIEQPWGSTIAHAGEVTFLTPDYYQIHQLKNPSPREGGQFCATIQCYRYADDNIVHYEYFDYIDEKKQAIEHFLPDSDWEYLEFKRLVQEEWKAAMSGQRPATA